MGELTREQFLKRCETAYDMGLMSAALRCLLDRWLDFVMRFEGGQMNHVADFIESEAQRTGRFHRALANDYDGYRLIQFAAILSHPCQLCAEDTNAWHTRSGFCEHKKP